MSVIVSNLFEDVELAEIANMPEGERDALPFGVVGLDENRIVTIYNATEARLAGLDPQKVIGAPFFEAIAQCMNNFMVAQRFEDAAELDEIIPFVLTLRMRPTKVRLRLLAGPVERTKFILIDR